MVKPRYRIYWFGLRPYYLEMVSVNNELCKAILKGEEVGLIVRIK